MKKAVFLSVSIFLMFLFSGCVGLGKDIQVSSLAQKKRHHEIIQIIQGDVDRQEAVSSFQLFLLAGAYYEIRDYENMLRTTGLLDKQLARGDVRFYGADLSVYPGILRGYAYLDQGQYDRAAKEASEAHALLNRSGAQGNGGYHAQLIDIMGILGVAQANLNHAAEADRCLGVLRGRDVGQGILGPEQFIAIARIHMARKQYREALAAILDPRARVSGPVTAFYDQTFQELPKFFILTKCLYETGMIQEARGNYDQLLQHPQIREVGGLYWPALLDRARIARREGQNETAEVHLREAVEVIEKQRSSITSEAGRIGYVGDKQAVYQELVALLMARNRPSEAFETVERAKGRALVDLLASQKNIAVPARHGAEVSAVFQKLAKVEQNLTIVADPGKKEEADRTRGVAIALKKSLVSQDPELTSLVSVTAAPVRDIMGRLAEDETLIEYYAAGQEWFVFVLTKNGVAAKRLGPLDLEKDVRQFRAALTDPASADYRRLGRELYGKLLLPVSGLLTTPRLTIVPHGPLHYLPFGALSAGDNYLIDRANIRILQTAGILKFLNKGPKDGLPALLVIGNPDLGDPRYDLKFAQEEAKAIAGSVPSSTLLLRGEAKASFVSRNAGQFSMIHFAAHGVFDPENPLDSALLLAGDAGSDGRLRAGDLYGLNLKADLVTLSACETALGKITQGDDVVGFTRGFLYAGAGAIVSTLWKVDDRATRDLMLDFYAGLAAKGKGEALRQAQLSTRKKYPHPFYWASFQLTGNAQ